MKILKSILNYIPLATFIIFVVTDGIFSLTSALIFVISTIGLLINCKRKKQRWRIEKISVYKIDYIRINVNGWAKLPHPFLKADWYLYRDGWGFVFSLEAIWNCLSA